MPRLVAALRLLDGSPELVELLPGPGLGEESGPGGEDRGLQDGVLGPVESEEIPQASLGDVSARIGVRSSRSSSWSPEFLIAAGPGEDPTL